MRGIKLSIQQLKEAKALREQGYSLPEISRTLEIAKTTLFNHIKNISILPEYQEKWLGKRGGSKKRKLVKEKIAKEEIEKIIGTMSIKDKLIALSCLYWAEGTKKDFSLSNTDPELVKTFINNLKTVFGVKTEQFRISIRIYEDLNKEESIDFWAKSLGIPKINFISVNVLKGKKLGKLRHGMVRIRVIKGGDLLKRISAANQIISRLSP